MTNLYGLTVAVALVAALGLSSTPATGVAAGQRCDINPPTIKNFRFAPATVDHGGWTVLIFNFSNISRWP